MLHVDKPDNLALSPLRWVGSQTRHGLIMFDTLIFLAAQLPTGLRDPQALGKLCRERQELDECLAAGDTLGAILEAGDVAYYAVKAHANDLMSLNAALHEINAAGQAVGLAYSEVLAVAEIKFALRAKPGNPKDDAAEREAVQHLLPQLQI